MKPQIHIHNMILHIHAHMYPYTYIYMYTHIHIYTTNMHSHIHIYHKHAFTYIHIYSQLYDYHVILNIKIITKAFVFFVVHTLPFVVWLSNATELFLKSKYSRKVKILHVLTSHEQNLLLSVVCHVMSTIDFESIFMKVYQNIHLHQIFDEVEKTGSCEVKN